MAKSTIHKQLEALIAALPIDKKEIIFVNRLKGEAIPEESSNKLIVIFDIGEE